MKKLFSVMLILVLLCALLAMPVSATGSGSLAMTSASGGRGETVTLSVNLNSNPGLVTMSIRVSYDTSVLKLTNVSNTGKLVGTQLNPSYGSPYTISWVDGAATTDNMATGTIANFTFQILDTAAVGDSRVTLQFVDSYDALYGENSFSASSGTVTVVCKNHEYGRWEEGNDCCQKTCGICADVQTASHQWLLKPGSYDATCKEAGMAWWSCLQCGAEKEEELPKTDDHSFGNLTAVDDDSHKDTCSVCQQEITQAHTWNQGTVTVKATCKEEGEMTYTCTGCKHTRTEVIPISTIHTWGKWGKVDADTHMRTCSVCEKEETGVHSYQTSWSKDKNNHWHACSVCGDRKDEEKHTPGAEATETTPQTCKVCSYVIKAALGHTHDYAQMWTMDEMGHWYSCAGCEEKGEYAEHNFENVCDSDCADCGYTRETGHAYGDQWSADEDNHWHVCAGCGDIQDKQLHTPGVEATATTAQTCTVCGHEIAPALGTPETEPVSNVTQPAATEPVDGDAEHGSEFPWWIVIIAVAVIAGAAVLVLIKRKV